MLSAATNVTPMPVHLRRVRANAPASTELPTALQTLQRAVRAADADGFARGEQQGHVAGWRWGLVCGFCLGLLLGSALVAGALWIGVSL